MTTTQVDISAYDNSWYKPGPTWKILLWIIVNAVFFNHSLAVISSLKCTILRMFGASIGKGVVIKPSVNIKYPWLLSIGDYTWIGENAWIDNLALVSIGNNVCISQGAMLLTGNHNFSSKKFDLIVKPITLEDGVWIGAKAVVCPGVHAASHAVLTVQSVASKDLQAYTIYRGNPAEPVKERTVS